MHRAILSIMLLTATAATAQTQINPVTQVNWAAATGTTAPTRYCPTSTTGSTVNGSPVVTVAATTDIIANQAAAGSGVPSGATVASVNATTHAVTLSANATATASGVGLTFSSLGMPYTNTTSGVQYQCTASGWTIGATASYPGVTSNGSNGLNVAGTVAAGNGVAGLISPKPFGSLPLTGWTSMNCFGDSRTLTFSGYTYGYCQQVASLVGVSSPTNYGVSGTYAADATNAVFNDISALSASTLNSYSIGVNDAEAGAFGLGEEVFNSIWNAAITWMGIPAANKYTGASFGSLPSGWTLDTTYAQVTGVQATANGATISFPYTVTANQTQNPVLWYGCINGDGGTFTVTDTGWFSVATPYQTTPPATIQTAATPSGKSVCSLVGAIPNRVPGTYALIVTKTNAVGSVHIYGLGMTPGDNATRSTPFVLAWDIYRLRLDLDSGPVQTFNADIRNNVSFLIQAGINVGLVNSQNRVFGTTGPIGTDFSDGSSTPRPDCGYVYTGVYIHGCQAVQNELLAAAQDPFYTPNPVNPQNIYGPLTGNPIIEPDPGGYIFNAGYLQQSGTAYLTGGTFLSGTSYFGGTSYADQLGMIPMQWPTLPGGGQLALTKQLPGAAQILTGNNIAPVGTPVCANNTPTVAYTPANANNTLVVSYFAPATTPVTFTDNLSNTYTLVVSNSYEPAIFVKIGGLSGITAINRTGGSSGNIICVNEYSGVLTTGITSTAFVGSPYSSTTNQSINSYTVMAGEISPSVTTVTASVGTIRVQQQNSGQALTSFVQDNYSATQSNTISGTVASGSALAYATLELESVPNVTAKNLTLLGSGCSAGTYAKADGSGCGTPAGTFNPASPGPIGGTTPAAGTFTAANALTYATTNTISFSIQSSAGVGSSSICLTGAVCDASGGTVLLTTGTGATAGNMFYGVAANSYGHYPRCAVSSATGGLNLDGLGAALGPANNTTWIFAVATPSSSSAYRVSYVCN